MWRATQSRNDSLAYSVSADCSQPKCRRLSRYCVTDYKSRPLPPDALGTASPRWPRSAVRRGSQAQCPGSPRPAGQEEAKFQPPDRPGPDDRRLRDIRRPAGHRVECPGREPKAYGQEKSRIDPSYELSDDHHRAHGADAAGAQDEARAHDRIVHEVLKIRRLNRHRGIIGETNNQDEDHAGGEVAVSEQGRAYERLARGERVNDEQVKRRGSDDGFHNNLTRVEPVQLLPA